MTYVPVLQQTTEMCTVKTIVACVCERDMMKAYGAVEV